MELYNEELIKGDNVSESEFPSSEKNDPCKWPIPKFSTIKNTSH